MLKSGRLAICGRGNYITQTMKKVLFVGDINVDVMMGGLASLPIVDKEITCASFGITIGSSAAICACAYASLGGAASFLGLAGRDDYGDFMLRGMNEFGVQTHLVRRTDQVRTGVTVNLIYQSTRTQVTYPGTISEFDGADVGPEELKGFDHIHFAGPYQQTRFRPHVTRLLALAKSLRISTSLDPQWDATQTWEYMDQWLELLTYLFVNEGEAMSIAKAPTLEEACKALQARTHCAIVKAGKEGAMVFAEGAIRQVPAQRVDVVDTTGAGDSFDAGFLYATWEKNLPLLEALKIGSAAGSRSCMFPGGVEHRSSYDDLIRLLSTPES
jgi:sugar/nucleoside kinase (ribokinase family)